MPSLGRAVHSSPPPLTIHMGDVAAAFTGAKAMYAMHDMLVYADDDFLKPPGLDVKVRVAKSAVHGKGVFASRDIDAGEIVTLFPLHMIAYHSNAHKAAVGTTLKQPVPSPVLAVTCGVATKPERIVSAKVPPCMAPNIMKEDAVNLRNEYMYQIRSNLTIVGDPGVQLSHFVGHMINDGASLRKTSTVNDVVRFVIGTTALNNAMFFCLGGFLVACVALKPIQKDAEVFASYGVPYWLNRVTNKTLDEYLASSMPKDRSNKLSLLYVHSLEKLANEAQDLVHGSPQVEIVKQLHDKCEKLCGTL